jgi:outer membrane protein assembly factor BamB
VIQSPPVVGPDGTIYLGVWGTINGILALDPDGSERWRFETRANSPLASSVYWHVHGAPAVLADGSLRVVSEEDDSPMYALNADGSLAWRVALGGGRFIGSVAVGADGSAYAMNPNDSLYAVNAAGQRQWAVKLQAITYWEMPAVDADGNLYTTSARPMHFLDSAWGVLERTSPAGAVTGSLNVPTVCRTSGSPAIASDGRILLGRTDGTVVAVSPDLSTGELWTRQAARGYDWREPGVTCSASPRAARCTTSRWTRCGPTTSTARCGSPRKCRVPDSVATPR